MIICHKNLINDNKVINRIKYFVKGIPELNRLICQSSVFTDRRLTLLSPGHKIPDPHPEFILIAHLNQTINFICFILPGVLFSSYLSGGKFWG